MLDLSRNVFNASLPEELAQLSELRVIDMSENRLTGTVPSSLGTLSKMVELYAFIRSVSNHIASHRIASHRIDLGACVYVCERDARGGRSDAPSWLASWRPSPRA